MARRSEKLANVPHNIIYYVVIFQRGMCLLSYCDKSGMNVQT